MEAETPATAIEQERVIAELPVELRELARHVLLGGFSKRGDPIGFHHAPGGRCPPGRRIDKVLERFPDGSYRAEVSFWDPARGWVKKRKPHTMFADELSPDAVVELGLEAYRQRTEEWVNYWRCATSTPRIAGYWEKDRGVTTFFPMGHK